MHSNVISESCISCIHNEFDCHTLIHYAKEGLIATVIKRLNESQKSTIKPGSIFVYSEYESGIKRWTDKREWTPSRVQGIFLVYKDLNGSLIKKTYSVTLFDKKWHIVAYSLLEWESAHGCCARFNKIAPLKIGRGEDESKRSMAGKAYLNNLKFTMNRRCGESMRHSLCMMNMDNEYKDIYPLTGGVVRYESGQRGGLEMERIIDVLSPGKCLFTNRIGVNPMHYVGMNISERNNISDRNNINHRNNISDRNNISERNNINHRNNISERNNISDINHRNNTNDTNYRNNTNDIKYAKDCSEKSNTQNIDSSDSSESTLFSSKETNVDFCQNINKDLDSKFVLGNEALLKNAEDFDIFLSEILESKPNTETNSENKVNNCDKIDL